MAPAGGPAQNAVASRATDPTRPMTTTLRDAGPDDRPFLLALFASTREQELSQVLWPAEVREVFLRLQFSAQASDYAAGAVISTKA